jgi:hypothetical protein
MRYRLYWLLAGVMLAFNAAAQLPAQKDTANGVTVSVTPGNLDRGSKTWDFTIVLDTHTQDLSDDLVKSVVLADDRGNEFQPLAWDGAAPGGHHRSGVLKFGAIDPQPGALELRLSRPGEAKARTFRWRLR